MTIVMVRIRTWRINERSQYKRKYRKYFITRTEYQYTVFVKNNILRVTREDNYYLLIDISSVYIYYCTSI